MAYKINNSACVGCQFCMRVCPAGAIGIKGPGYWIDPGKCVSCGECAKVCHSSLIYDENAPAPKAQPHDPVYLTCDLLVVGAGGVGTGAAARAALGGLDVVLIEAAKHYGGGTYYAHGGVFPMSQRVYGRLGIQANNEMNVQRWLMMSGGRLTREQLERNIAYNGEFIDWFDSLEGNYGKVFTKGSPGFPFEIDMPQRHVNETAEDDSIGPGWMGSYITEKLFETAVKNGARYFSGTRARQFLTDGQGHVTGVLATDEGGEVYITSKAVILGSGCYLYNDAKMNELCPGYVRGEASVVRLNVPTNVGDGHAMAEKLGAKVTYKNMNLRGAVHHPYCYPIYKMFGSPEMLMVSDEGVRFYENPAMHGPGPGPGDRTVDGKKGGKEEAPQMPPPMTGGNGELLLKMKTGKCYAILDADTLELLGSRILSQKMVGHDDYLDHWRETIEQECAYESWPARKAGSIEALAEKLGMDPAVLRATVDRYNALCQKGEDEDFHKDPSALRPILKAPFYAFLGQNFENGASMGGIAVDDDFRMVLNDDSVVPNVFCAGDCASADLDNNRGPVGLLGGLGGSWASGYRMACIAEDYIKGLEKA